MRVRCLAAVFAVVLGTPCVLAETPCGVVLCPSDLAVDDAQRLVSLIDDARASNPVVFEQVVALRAALPEIDAAKRGRFAVLGPALAGLGAEALPAFLERLFLADPGPDGLTASAWMAWRLSLIEAVGRLRDDRAAAALEGICRHPAVDTDVLTVAAGALGKLETDAVAAVLVELSRGDDARGRAILAGMGHCRRLVVAHRLAAALLEPSDGESIRAVARSLATAASAPVWRAGLVTHPEEGAEIRRIAAQALVERYVIGNERDRRELTTALLVVDEPMTFSLIAGYRSNASPELLRALDRLTKRLESNPVARFSTPSVASVP